jgi:hypothetical protein
MKTIAGACLAFAVVATAVPTARPQKAADLPALDVLVARAADYVTAYQRDFAFLVADEQYVQDVNAPKEKFRESRTTKGEMFLTFIEADDEWVAVHDVVEVDGAPAQNKIDVRALLALGAVRSVAAQVVSNNARYNIGRVGRNINQPTFALLALGARRRANFSFSRGDVDRTQPARTLVTLRFKEGRDAAIVHTGENKPVPSRGDITIDADTGRVVRTLIEFELGSVKAEQTTTYSPEERLNLWVPTLFTEKYVLKAGSRVETTTCTATYTNFRRFAATGRIKK